jgi:branched-chain amino acid transport system permease protein
MTPASSNPVADARPTEARRPEPPRRRLATRSGVRVVRLLRGGSGEQRWRLGVRIAVIAVFAYGLSGNDYQLQGALTVAAYPAALAVIYSLVLGYTNVFNFAWNAVVGLGAYAFAYAEVGLGANLPAATLLAICISAVASALIVIPSAWMSGFQLALIAIAAGTVFNTALLTFTSVSGGSSGLTIIRRWFELSPLETRSMLIVAVSIMTVACFVVAVVVRGQWGREMVTVGDDEFLAQALGTRVQRVRIVTAAGAGALTGFVASFAVQQSQVALPDAYGLPLLIQVFLVLIVGGRRSIWGPVAASLLIVGLPSYVGGINGNVLTIAFAALVIVTVIARPNGLYGEPIRDRHGLLGGRRATSVGASPSVLPHSDRDVVALEVHDLRKSFGRVTALDGVSFSVSSGEVLGIVGSNGSGKTTLLNCLNGIWRADHGEAVWVDRSGRRVPSRLLTTSALARRRVGRGFQVPRVFEGLTLRDNLRVGLDGHHVHARELLIETALDHWRLRQWADRPVTVLPHGARRWLELARLDLSRATFMLLDEPAAGLTDDEVRFLQNAVDRWRGEGRCVVLVEHNHRFVANVCDRTLVMASGAVVAVGDLEELRREERVRAVIGDRLD